MPVPALVDMAEPPYVWQDREYHWYRCIFAVPQMLKRSAAFVCIEQSMFGTAVWLNGQFIGSDIACYTSQVYRVDRWLRFGEENELLVRVGAKHTLPPESAVGNDFERLSWIPGIYGDVRLVAHDSPRIQLVQTIPHLDRSLVRARIWVENLIATAAAATLAVQVIEKASGRPASARFTQTVGLQPFATELVEFEVTIPGFQAWSPDTPFLYELVTTAMTSEGQPSDETRTSFGMREFKIAGADFYLNGRKIYLRGSNIAFHRFLSDRQRGLLPWRPDWIRKVLVEIPKAHHFNSFRIHLGQAYNRWYDIADEGGILLQNEWMFWTTTGTKEQIKKEFTRWLQDNWNHPSIVIWDPLNESSNDDIQNEIVPIMRSLDPTRPWAAVDFVEDHPYIFSLGPVLPRGRFGFSRSLHEIKNSPTPSVVNEYLWWWIDSDGKPSRLTVEVADRWLGEHYTPQDLLTHQCFLAAELTELFRRLRVRAIQPFVYLSCNEGPTSHWFQGHIENLEPKPILAALKSAFSPFGVSMAIWDRHFLPGEVRRIPVHLFNDTAAARRGILRFGIVRSNGEWITATEKWVAIPPADHRRVLARLVLPSEEGRYLLCAEIREQPGAETVARSQKTAYVLSPPEVPAFLSQVRIVLFEPQGEIGAFLKAQGLRLETFDSRFQAGRHILLIGPGEITREAYRQKAAEITAFVRRGGALILLEPEWGCKGKQNCAILEGLHLQITRREDRDRGGYDSYVFPTNPTHPIWRGIEPEHLRFFNGALGGEIVSQYDVVIQAPHRVLARCGLQLRVTALAEIPYGQGLVLVSRLQVRGRLHEKSGQSRKAFARRPDPVAQRHLINLLAYAHRFRD